jgi:adenosylcobinamide-GDP ribazoletransferase
VINRVPAIDEEPAATGATAAPPEGRGGPVGRVAAEVRAATAMLTRLPVRDRPTAATGSRAFAIVGGVIGGAACVPLLLLGSTSTPVAAILAIAVMVVLSGGLHLDGLADTADALVAIGPDAADRARNDPRIGVGGVLALILVLGLEAASLTLVVEGAGVLVGGVLCVIAASTARAVPVILAPLSRRHAAPSGLGAWFVARTGWIDAFVAAGLALGVALAGALAVSTPVAIAAALTGTIGGVGFGLGLVRLRGQLDGDVLGASVEVAFAMALAAGAVLVS